MAGCRYVFGVNGELIGKLLLLGVEWVEGDICEASVEFFNPLPFDIEVSSLVRTHTYYLYVLFIT